MRKLLFWLHLAAGVVAGLIIFIMSVTGVLLMYEKQMIAWFDVRELPAIQGAQRMPIESLLEQAKQQRGKVPASIVISSDPSAPAQLSVGRDIFYQDPSSGKIIGAANLQVRAFFRTVTDWHRWLAITGPQRPTARAITGYANLAFLFIVLSGIYLWLPRVWTKSNVRAVAFFKSGLSGKARDFNWHNVLGIWSAIPLVFVVASATVISFPWASNLVYALTGTKAPAPASQPAPAPKGAEPSIAGLNAAYEKAAATSSTWRTLTLRVPATQEAPVSFVIDHGYAGQPQKRVTLNIDRQSAEIRSKESFDDFNTGRQTRTWMRFVHTGEYYGLPGQTIAGIASAAAAVLVFTGIALSLRRFSAWRARRARADKEVLIEA
jgi:uncharacterized iron-regulated membrane protein